MAKQVNFQKTAEQRQDAALKSLISYMKYCPVLTEQEEQQLFKRLSDGDLAVKREIMRRNLKMVIAISKSHWHKATLSYSVLEMIDEGVLGLSRAIDKFDPSKGYRFSTYAGSWIDQYIRNGLCNTSTTIRYPRHLYERRVRVSLACKNLLIRKKTDRRLTLAEIAQESNLTVQQVSDVRAMQPVASLNVTNSYGFDESREELLNFVPSEQEAVLDVMTRHLDRVRLRQLLKLLSRRDANIVRQLYGVDCQMADAKTIAKQHGISPQTVNSISRKAIQFLRRKNQSVPFDLAS